MDSINKNAIVLFEDIDSFKATNKRPKRGFSF